MPCHVVSGVRAASRRAHTRLCLVVPSLLTHRELHTSFRCPSVSIYRSLSLSLSLICPFACQKTCAGQALTMSNISDILRSRCLPAARAGVRARVSFP